MKPVSPARAQGACGPIGAFLEAVGRTSASFRYPFEGCGVGRVLHIERDVALVDGLPDVEAMELVRFEGGRFGVALDLDRDRVGVALLDPESGIEAGDRTFRTKRVLDVPVGRPLLGRVIDPIGRPLDGKPPPRGERLPVERPAPAILEREAVCRPLLTGIKAIDSMIPIGRGQRELILGDRQTGKTAIAVDTILNQKDVVCIYCAIGQRAQAVARVIDRLKRHGALRHTVVVAAAGDAPAGLQFIAPYAATSIGEWFREQGEDVLVVYDDLSRHADAYRELSLLLRRPPGREAYPGDIFYIHARLLERSAQLEGGGSLTALPIAETQAQNIAAYIPTNLISITDGQIYLSPVKFQRGELPAVDVGLSVSRVGGRAQFPTFRLLSGPLKLSYAQFEELETFARFATRLDERTKRAIERGRRVRELLKQDEGDLYTPAEQVAVLLALNEGLFDPIPLEKVREAEAALRRAVRERPEWEAEIASPRGLSERKREELLQLAREVLAPWRP